MATTMEEHAISAGKAFPWHEVYVPDAQKAIDFYTEAFGMGTQSMDMGGGFTYNMLTVDGKGVAGVMSTNNPDMQGVPPQWATYMSVDDVDARLAKAQSLGATVVVPPMDVPNVGRMAMIADPQGAHIWLYKDANV